MTTETSENPYSTPEASLDNQLETTFYQPKVLSFSGRIGRLRYLAYNVGVNLLLAIPIGLLASQFSQSSSPIMGGGLVLLYFLAIVLSIMFSKRRLNDLDRSGWWILLFIVPVVNLLLAIYLIFFSGSENNNRYGEIPNENTIGVKLLAFSVPVIMLLGIVAAIAIPSYMGYVEKANQQQMQQNQ